MTFDIKTAISSIAPTLATMLGGPLAGTAVTALEGALGLAPGSGTDGITQVMQSGTLTPDQIAAVRAADQKHAEIMSQQGIDLQKLNADHDLALVQAEQSDMADARKNNSGRDALWTIAWLVLVTFVVIMSLVLYGCWMLLQGGIQIKDVSTVAAIAGLVGAIVGYVAANAQQVLGFMYGGSLGSNKHVEALANSVSQAITTLGK